LRKRLLKDRFHNIGSSERGWLSKGESDRKEHRKKSDKLLLLALLLFNLLALVGVGAAIVWAFRTVF